MMFSTKMYYILGEKTYTDNTRTSVKIRFTITADLNFREKILSATVRWTRHERESTISFSRRVRVFDGSTDRSVVSISAYRVQSVRFTGFRARVPVLSRNLSCPRE